MQEFTCLVHRAGSGISHGIGTGSRDLSDEIGGLSTLTALDALEADDRTKVIVLLSKPSGTATMRGIVERLQGCAKPIVACLLGSEPKSIALGCRRHTRCIQHRPGGEARARSGRDNATGISARGRQRNAGEGGRRGSEDGPAQRYIRGLFAGGTFCYQSQSILRDGGTIVYSNSPLEGMRQLVDPAQSSEHSLIDMGAETFVAGRPHPMIDRNVRRERILARRPIRR